jgi:hypothetical protein
LSIYIYESYLCHVDYTPIVKSVESVADKIFPPPSLTGLNVATVGDSPNSLPSSEAEASAQGEGEDPNKVKRDRSPTPPLVRRVVMCNAHVAIKSEGMISIPSSSEEEGPVGLVRGMSFSAVLNDQDEMEWRVVKMGLLL